jgi:hypothetical protein
MRINIDRLTTEEIGLQDVASFISYITKHRIEEKYDSIRCYAAYEKSNCKTNMVQVSIKFLGWAKDQSEPDSFVFMNYRNAEFTDETMGIYED